jgi:DNA-binding MarR family transcriptional regulator
VWATSITHRRAQSLTHSLDHRPLPYRGRLDLVRAHGAPRERPDISGDSSVPEGLAVGWVAGAVVRFFCGDAFVVEEDLRPVRPCEGKLFVEGIGREVFTGLAASGGITQPAMTQLVGRLERDDLVVRLIDPDDGRARVVDITDAGRATLAQHRQTQRDNLDELLEALSPDDEASLCRFWMNSGTSPQITTYSRRDGDLFERDPKPTVNLVCTTVTPWSGLSMRPNLCCSPAS